MPACAGRELADMHFVYLIHSITHEWTYVGLTADIEARLEQHNLGRVTSTKNYKPFKLLFVQEVTDRLEARDLEVYLKIKWNKESLIGMISL